MKKTMPATAGPTIGANTKSYLITRCSGNSTTHGGLAAMVLGAG
jgi:hypothetical protein